MSQAEPQGALAAISRALGLWDAATGHPAYRLVGVAVGLAVFVAVLSLPSPDGLTPAAHRVLAVGVLMALWWLGRVLPLAVTAMLPVVMFPVLGVFSFADAVRPFAHPLNALMLGGFVLGHAMERAGLHERLVAALMAPAWVRAAPARVVGALMVAAAVFSGLASNTATTVMLLPVALELGRRCTASGRQASVFVLALAYAASIGGVSTLIGTPPNAILAEAAPQVTFAAWLAVGAPFVVLAIPVAWLVLTRLGSPLPRRFDVPPGVPASQRWSAAEVAVLGLVLLALLGWLTRSDVVLGQGWVLPGWGGLLPSNWSHDALVAAAVAPLLFLVPGLPKARRRDGEGRFLLSARSAERGIPWSVLILLGGGFSLAAAVKATALTEWLAKGTRGLAQVQDAFGPGSWVGLIAVVLLVSLLLTFLTELTSNTATTQIVLPVLATGAAAAGVDPLYWMVPATISASCAFMMPVATAPNAIASQAGGVSPGDMAWSGLLLNLALVGIAALVTLIAVPWL